MKKHLINPYIFGIAFSIAVPCFSQIDFMLPDTMCIGDSMQVVYNSSYDAHSYFWNFCSGSLGYIPMGENLTNVGQVNGPAFIDLVKYNGEFYSFVTNHSDGTLTRNYFGNNLLNDPVSVNLGQLASSNHLEGIQIIEDNGNWYGFMVGGIGNQSSLIRLEFPNGLSNNPVVTDLGNIGNLSYPIDFFLYRENGLWTGFTANYTTSTLTRLSFTNGPENAPQGENLGNIGSLNEPCGIHAIRENGNWYLFITNFGSSTLSRLDFGNSLQNANPAGTNLGGNGSLQSPFDLTIIKDCEHIFGFVANHYNNELVRMDFGMNIESQPVYESIGNVGDLYQPHGISEIFRENDILYFLVANINNTLSRIYFQPCTNASIASSTDKNPPKVTYNQPGEYNVSLIIDEGLPTQEILCKNVMAFANPVITLGNDTTILPGTSIELSPGEGFSQYDWTTGENSSSIIVSEPGDYRVIVTDSNSCSASDEITVSIAFYIPDFFTPNGDGINDRWEIVYFQTNPNATIEVFDRFGKKLITYRGNDPGWNGTYMGNKVKADTYWYVITFDDGSKPKTGYVAIIR